MIFENSNDGEIGMGDTSIDILGIDTFQRRIDTQRGIDNQPGTNTHAGNDTPIILTISIILKF